MDLAAEFLENADECLRLAQEAHTIEAQIQWLSMAQFWRNLARQIMDEDLIASGQPIPENGKSNGDENGNSEPEH